jgi:hypothetical protein
MSDEKPQDDRSLLFSHLDRIEEKQDRAVGLAAQAVMLAERSQRLAAANQQLDARTRQEAVEIAAQTMRTLKALSESRDAALARMTSEEVAAILPQSTIDGARRAAYQAALTGSPLAARQRSRRRRDDDTVSLVLHVGKARVRITKKHIAAIFAGAGTAIGWFAHWIAALHK